MTKHFLLWPLYLIFVERWNLSNRTKHQITCMRMSRSNPVPVTICGTRLYWKMFLKVIFLLKLIFFPKFRLWTRKFSHACELYVVMYHIRANFRLLGFSNCVYLSWIFWVCDVLVGGVSGIFWFCYIPAGIALGWIPSAVTRATLQTFNISSWFTQGLGLSFQLAT